MTKVNCPTCNRNEAVKDFNGELNKICLGKGVTNPYDDLEFKEWWECVKKSGSDSTIRILGHLTGSNQPRDFSPSKAWKEKHLEKLRGDEDVGGGEEAAISRIRERNSKLMDVLNSIWNRADPKEDGEMYEALKESMRLARCGDDGEINEIRRLNIQLEEAVELLNDVLYLEEGDLTPYPRIEEFIMNYERSNEEKRV